MMAATQIHPKIVKCESHRWHRCPVCKKDIEPNRIVLRFDDKVYDKHVCAEEGARMYIKARNARLGM